MRNNRTFKLALIAILGALSAVLMLFEIPLPFAPSFLKFDVSELPALFAGFFIGPLAGCLVELLKILLHLLFVGTQTVYVGEAMNLIGSCCFVLPASIIYRKMHTKKGAIIGMAVATIIASIVYVVINATVSFPMYVKLYGIPMDAIIAMGSASNPLVSDYWSLMLLSVLPFNLVKHTICSIVTYLLYKRTGKALRKLTARFDDKN